MKPIYRGILAGVVVLALAAVGIIWYVFTEKFTDTTEVKPDYTVLAVDLIKEFQQNDSAANKKYTEKIVSVKGVVSEILAVPGDSSVNIKMADTGTGDYLIFTFQQDMQVPVKIKAGQEVSIKGSCSGGIYSEILGTRYVSFKRSVINKQ